jgi:hypothetical protein
MGVDGVLHEFFDDSSRPLHDLSCSHLTGDLFRQ